VSRRARTRPSRWVPQVREANLELLPIVSMIQGLLTLLGRTALRAKNKPDEAEAEGFGGSKVEADNEVWLGFRRNPSGRANFPGLVVARRSKMPDIRRSSLLDPVKIGSRRCRPNSVNRP